MSAFRVIITSPVSTFRAIIITFLVWRSESHFQFRRSEPSSSHFWFRRSEPSSSHFQLGVQSHHHHFSVSRFRVIIITSQYRRSESSSSHSQCWRSEPSSLLSFGAQSHHFSVWRSESHSQFRFSKPSSVFSLTFRVAFSVWRSESSPSLFSFGVQSHHRVFRLAFIAFIITLQFRRSESQLHSTFRAITSFIPVFRAMFCFLRHSESHLCSTFRAIAYSSFQRSGPHLLSAFSIFIWHSDPHLHLAFRSTSSFGVQSHCLFLLRVQSRGFSSTLKVLVPIFRSIHHLFPNSGIRSHRARPFGSFDSFLFFGFGI